MTAAGFHLCVRLVALVGIDHACVMLSDSVWYCRKFSLARYGKVVQ